MFRQIRTLMAEDVRLEGSSVEVDEMGTDEFVSYHGPDRIDGMEYQHRRINHGSKVYVMGDVHTQTIEGFWSLVEPGLGGVYHSVSQKYLQTCLNEYSFRYNRRASGNLIFPAMLARVYETVSSKPSAQVKENPVA